MDLAFFIIPAIVLAVIALLLPVFFRVVVPTNEVHIVQTGASTTSYGKDTQNGNSYYLWPSWIPVLGTQLTIMPVSVFDVDLHQYEAYDKGRLPFIVDVKAFFRVSDSNIAAQRVASFEELREQLTAIVQGAVRTVLASNEIEEIMQGRGKFGDEFTSEVREQLKNWGVEAVKNIELMDIKDSKGSSVIDNIMNKKKSHIEMQSRQEVAANNRAAEVSEIEAKREVALTHQQARQQVGLRTVEARQEVEIAEEKKKQLVSSQAKETREKDLAITYLEQTKMAEIEREAAVTKADQEAKVMVRQAEAELETKTKEAQAIRLKGEAVADAERSMQMAPIMAQIELSREIGSNESYQKYLITVEQIKANKDVGIEQAKALTAADVKVITNSGTPENGLKDIMDLFSSHGGASVGAMLEGFVNTSPGKKIIEKLTGTH